MSVFEEIKAKLPLSDVVRTRVKLQARGNHWVGLCPFHNEKTPSFTVSDMKKSYFCFGCQNHGDIFNFVAKIEGCSAQEALQRLAQMANVDIGAMANGKEQETHVYYWMLAIIHKYFRIQLQNSLQAQRYLHSRDLQEELWQHLQLGYAPYNRQDSIDYLINQGFSREQILTSGLVSQNSRKDNLFFLFNHRIMFPIFDARNRVVGFGGRDISNKSEAKYINSAENEHFKKSKLLYNLPILRTLSSRDLLLVVEGYTDVAALTQNGIENCVAVLGTAMGEQQLQMLWKVVDRPCICFDGDQAGERAMFAFMKRALAVLPLNKSLEFVLLPRNEDPDSMVRTHGPDAFLQAVRSSTDLLRVMKMYIEKTLPGYGMVEGNYYLHGINDLVELITDQDTRQFYKEELKKMFATKLIEKQVAVAKISKNTYSLKQSFDESMLAILLYHPQLGQHDEAFILALELRDNFLNVILQTFIESWERLIYVKDSFRGMLEYLKLMLQEKFQNRQLSDGIYKKSCDWLHSIADAEYCQTSAWTGWRWDEDQEKIVDLWENTKKVRDANLKLNIL